METKRKNKNKSNRFKTKKKGMIPRLEDIFRQIFHIGGKRLDQSGGGYTVHVGTNIGNQPEIVGYNDQTPPIYINGQLIFGQGVTPICGIR